MSFWDGTRWIDEPNPTRQRPGQTQRSVRTRVADAIATAAIVIGMAALFIPFKATDAVSSSIALAPGSGSAGDRVQVTGTSFKPRTNLQTTWDGNPSGMPKAKVDASGAFAITFVVPNAKLGSHTVAVAPMGFKGKKPDAQLASAAPPVATAFLVVAAISTPIPTAAPTPTVTERPTAVPATPTPTVRPPDPTPSPTATPRPTQEPTPAPTPTRTPTPTPEPTPTPNSFWNVVVDDQFGGTSLPGHWHTYNGPYGAYNPGSCAAPGHVTVSDGWLQMLFSHEDSGTCGPGWYSGGLALAGFSSVDARITLRFRVVNNGAQSHHVIPMRWPDNDGSWPAGGEEDYCEGVGTTCSTFLHYGSSNSQIYNVDYITGLGSFRTLQTVRRDHVVKVLLDGNLLWTYNGTATTLPDTMKHVVLQQECSFLSGGCPSGKTGNEQIQIDWIRVEVPA